MLDGISLRRTDARRGVPTKVGTYKSGYSDARRIVPTRVGTYGVDFTPPPAPPAPSAPLPRRSIIDFD